MSLQTNASSGNIFDAAKIFDSKRKSTRFDGSSKIKIRIQKSNATKQFLAEEIVAQWI
ncbi:MAG: hypothetical protein JKX85_07520 [Phycisphaeraceae bacterium]|nr:hypothetical protein [Phycisphaeraceae bacterium]